MKQFGFNVAKNSSAKGDGLTLEKLRTAKAILEEADREEKEVYARMSDSYLDSLKRIMECADLRDVGLVGVCVTRDVFSHLKAKSRTIIADPRINQLALSGVPLWVLDQTEPVHIFTDKAKLDDHLRNHESAI